MKTRRLCLKCFTLVKRETKIKGYPFYCPYCNENVYSFETVNVNRLKRTAYQRLLTDIKDTEVDRLLER